MTINKEINETELLVKIEGRIDTMTAPELESFLKESLNGITDLNLDFTDVSYISSAGLRVLLSSQKIMNKQGSMKVMHVNDMIMEIFEVTGFKDIMDIQ